MGLLKASGLLNVTSVKLLCFLRAFAECLEPRAKLAFGIIVLGDDKFSHCRRYLLYVLDAFFDVPVAFLY
jgi:hypothetical protein